VVVINLDDRPERWQETLRELAVFPDAPVPHRISAVRGVDLPGYGQPPWFRGRTSDKRWAGRGGCTQSHRKVMQIARERDWRTFLVLEDDACLQPLRALPAEQLEQLLFVQQTDWDACYLGFSKAVGGALRLAAIGDRQLFEVVGCYTTHAYLVRARARDWILAHLAEDGQAWSWHAQHRIIDRWYTRHLSQHLRVLALSPSLITQRAGFSDIVQRQVDYAEEYAGRLLRVTDDPKVFARQRRRQHWKFWWADRYDWVRAQFKRWNGF
jgi:hypothetical protein